MSLADLAIKRPFFITCIVVVLIAVGLLSFSKLGVDLFPDVTFPVVTVTTNYLGAGPAEIETLISKPLEDEISTISGIKRLTSKNIEGVSQVIAEFHLETDIKYAEQQVRDKISVAKPKLPKEAKEPIIRRIDPADQPIMTLALQADLPEGKLFDLADQVVKNRIQQVNDVGLVEIVGGRKREIQVQLNRQLLKQRELSASGVAAQIGVAGENVPSGKVNNGDNETIFRSMGEFQSTDDISSTLVNLFGNDTPTRVSDIGRVADTLEDEKTRAFVNGKKTLFVDVYRQSGTNTLAVVNGVKAKLGSLNSELSALPGAGNLKIIRDGSKEIQDNVDDVKETIYLGIILTVLVVYFFLGNGRSTIITGLALPNSLIGSFILMAIAGFTINIVSLLALSLAVGLLIDDAIVVRENIFRHLEDGEDAITAAREGTKQVQLAVVATTLVVMAVFGPVAFTKGIVGQFLKQFGLTVCFAMAISLFDALTIAPMLSAYFAGGLRHKSADSGGNRSLWGRTVGGLLRGFESFQVWLEKNYERVLHFTLKWPKSILFASFLVLVASFYSLGFIPKTFLPPQDNGEFIVALDLPPGTNLDAMNRFSALVDEQVRSNSQVQYTTLTVGGPNNEPEKAEIYVRLVPSKDRKGINTSQMKERIRTQLVSFAKGNPKVKDYDPTGGGGGRPFLLRLLSNDQKQLEDVSSKVLDELKKDKRLKDLDSSYRPGKPEFQVKLRPDAARAYGVNTGTLGDELRTEVEGVTPAKFRQSGQEYDVRVRLQEDQRDLQKAYASVYVPNVNRKIVRLTDVADATVSQGPASIDRQDRSRYIELSGDIAAGQGLGDVINDVIKKLSTGETKLPLGVRYMFVGDSENFQELGSSILLAFGFAILFIYLVLTSLYESPITPFTIMLALPLALCGAFLGLFFAHETLSLFAVLGIVMLLGVASKNSILLVDYTRHAMEERGLSRYDALIAAGKNRLRPILMTSMALIAGIFPVALGLSEASKQRTGMGWAIIGGLVSSTLLSLIVVPAAFMYIDRFRHWVGVAFNRFRGL